MDTLMKQLLQHLKLSDKQQVVIPSRRRAYCLSLLAELLEQGFSLNQSLSFMQLLLPKEKRALQFIAEQLSRGEPLEKCLKSVGYPIAVVAQLFYAQRQGRLMESLRQNSMHLQQIRDFRQKLIKTLSYPLLMSVFLIILLFGMRQFMLPHIIGFISVETYENNQLVRLLLLFFTYLPQGSAILLALAVMNYVFFDAYLMKLSPMKRYLALQKIRPFRKWSQWHATLKISRELGYFFEAGYSLQQMLEVMVKYPIDPFLAEVAQQFTKGLSQGKPLADIIEACTIFTPVFQIVLHQGELTSQTGAKCLLYAEQLLSDLQKDIQQKLGYLQPILFIVIALLVVAMYLVMLLPMLTMEGF